MEAWPNAAERGLTWFTYAHTHTQRGTFRLRKIPARRCWRKRTEKNTSKGKLRKINIRSENTQGVRWMDGVGWGEGDGLVFSVSRSLLLPLEQDLINP